MRVRNQAVFGLKNEGVGAVKHSGAAPREARRVLAQLGAPASGLDADHLYFAVADEIIEQAKKGRARDCGAQEPLDRGVPPPSR